MLIQKRNGSMESFDPQKLQNALAATSDEIQQPLNQSDLDDITGEVARILEGGGSLTTRDVYTLTAGLLYTRGLHRLLEAYTRSTRNAWR